MNIVVAAVSAPAQLNGVSRHGVNLARALLSNRAVSNVHFIAGEWQREMFRSTLQALDSRLHMHWVSLPDANLSRLVWYFRELPCIVFQLDSDIVHLTYPVPIAANAFHCPAVLSLHDLYPFDIPKNFGFAKSALARRTMQLCIKRADAIACVSAGTQARLTARFPTEAKKSTVIPNVVELEAAAGGMCSFDSLRQRSFVLCVAQHRCNKNLPLAIQAFERLARNRIIALDARLVIVGIPGPETLRIEAQIRKSNLNGKVLFYAGLPDSHLRWCYENCAVLLATSSLEGFGLPIAEGMLAGARIVCSDIPEFREIGGDYCRFVPLAGEDRAGAFADAIRETLILPRPPRSRLPHMSLAAVGQQYAELYGSLPCSRSSESGMLRQPKSGPIVPAGSKPM